jgi:hypothetical protein
MGTNIHRTIRCPCTTLGRRPLRALRAAICVVAMGIAPSASSVAADQPAAVTTPDGGHYRGPLVQGLRAGQGRIDWDNGAYYEGGFVRGLFSGHGHHHLSSGDDYDGDFELGLASGKGRLLAADGSTYTGDFRRGVPEGTGHYVDGHGSVYDGQFHAGHFEGVGKLVTPRAVFQGTFRAGQADGPGEVRYTDGHRYRGAFVQGRFHGQGRYDAADGEQSYEGQFVDDEFTGQGTYTSKANGSHTGQFLKWRPDGPGRYTDAQGNVYEGAFSGGLPQGPVRLRYRDGSRYEGELKGWLPSGPGVLSRANGDVYRGDFAEGVFEGQGTLTYAKPRADGKTREEGWWHYGRLGAAGAEALARANIEAALYSQPSLLARSFSGLKPRDPEAINLYLLEVAGDGSQEVFRREVDFVHEQFDRRFGTGGHSVQLINSRNTIELAPLATVTSIRDAVTSIAAHMDRDKDILFVFLTSHGSRDHRLVLELEGAQFPSLSAAELGQMLRESGITWKVVVVSACYAGGFIEPLRDGHTLVLTAARQDRRSFGCADDNDFTYFGRAFFQEALPGSDSFQAAFAKSRELIAAWEERDIKASAEAPAAGVGPAALGQADGAAVEDDTQIGHSLPQIENPPAIEAYLALWWVQAVHPGARADKGPAPAK